MAVRQICFVGDSITHAGSPATLSLVSAGGKGVWAELVTELLASITGIGPLISAGFRSTWMVSGAQGSTEWSSAGSWTTPATTDAWDRGPYGDGQYSAAGTTAVKTWTRPTQWRPVVGFAIYFGDYTSGGNWSYRVDGGTWINMGQTLAHDNLMGKFYVNTPVSSTVEIRAANAAGTAAGCCVYGIEPFFLSPLTTTQGLIAHNLGRNGSPLDDLVLATSGDRMAFFDAVKVDPVNGGGAISNQPTTGMTMQHVNDIRLFGDSTKWATDIATFYARVGSIGPLRYISYGEMNAADYNTTTQATYRTQTKTSAALHSIPVLDFYDIWTAQGFGTGVGTQNAALLAAGLITVTTSPVDNGHPTQRGHFDMASHIYPALRNSWFSSVVGNPQYPVSAKQAAKQYTGKLAAVQYAAGTPISI